MPTSAPPSAITTPPPDSRARNAARIIAMLVIVALGTLHVLPELANAVWQDEAATLMIYASDGIGRAFSDYSMPNNHMLFSAVVSALWSQGDGVAGLRLVTLATWVVTLAMLAGSLRQFAYGARLCALALFAGSAVAAAFALQLRGYAFSWPFALLACATAPAFAIGGRRVAGLLYALATFTLVAIVPTNALVAATCAGWTVLILARRRERSAGAWWRAVALMALPVIALAVVYWPHVDDMRRHAAGGWSRWSDIDLVGHWLTALLGQYLPLLPLMALGLGLAIRSSPTSRNAVDDEAVALLLALIGTLGLTLLVLPMALFPRSLVPLLPLWCVALGALLHRGWIGLPIARGLRPPWATVLAGLLVFLVPYLLPACAGVDRGDTTRATLCTQFYRDGYVPRAAYDFLPRPSGGAAPPPIMLDSESIWALGFIAWNERARDLRLVDFRAWREKVGPAYRPELVVTRRGGALDRMLKVARVGLPHTRKKVFDEGFFEVWSLRWAQADATMPR